MVIIAVFPGQGSQSPGFLAPWLEREGAAQRLQQYSDWAGVDLVAAGTEWDADRIRDTRVAQPLIVAASLLSWNALDSRENVVGVAGHSVGEFAAAAASGILSEEDALRLVGLRGRAMAEAAAAQESGMSAVIGGDEATVVARLEELGLTPANYNGGGQLVAAGALGALQTLAAEPPAGTRVIPLAVAGAFHTDFMSPAVATLRQAAAEVEPHDPSLRIWTNRDGAAIAAGAAYRDLLVDQVASPRALGPVHGRVRRGGRPRHHRARPCGHAGGPRQASPARRACGRRQDPGRPRRRGRTSDRRNSMTPALVQATGPAHTRIYSYGAARGENDVPNDDLVGPIDSSDEWIRQRTGIVSRVRANKETTAIDLATDAATEAIARSGIDPKSIDAVIIATVTNPKQTPSVAAIVADRVGANPAAAYDINAACAGFSYGVAQADALIRGGLAHYAVVVGAEKLSDVVDPTDRSISFLLGDGAGAVVIGPSDTPGIGPTVWGSDGSKSDAIAMNATLTQFRDGEVPWPTLRQEGQAVFRWAVWEMVKVARQALEAAGVESSDLAAFVPHQANMRIIDEFAKQLKIPATVVIARDIETTGNTSAASIPLATHRLLEEHPELSGGLALQIGFGAGLVFGAQVIVLP